MSWTKFKDCFHDQFVKQGIPLIPHDIMSLGHYEILTLRYYDIMELCNFKVMSLCINVIKKLCINVIMKLYNNFHPLWSRFQVLQSFMTL